MNCNLTARTGARGKVPFFCDNPQEIVRTALSEIGPEKAYWLLSAYGAKRARRALNAEESAAKEAYAEALTQECRMVNAPIIKGFDAFDVEAAVDAARELSATEQRIYLALNAMDAINEGRTPSEEECAALQAMDATEIELWRLAGFEVAGPEEDS